MNGLVYAAADKAEFLADHLQSVHETIREDDSDNELGDAVEECLRSLPEMEGEDLAPTTTAELKAVIGSLKPGKEPGYDSIPNTAIRKLPSRILDELPRIINAACP